MLKASRKPTAAEQADARRRAEAALAAMTDQEDAEITAAALADPDAQPADELFSRRSAISPMRRS